jgi:hypothetical protein
MQVSLSRARAVTVDRSGDRIVALWSIAIAVTFLVAAFASLLLPEAARNGLWLPVHLALAGSATTAIAGVMPFFVAAFAAAQPADLRVRAASVAGVAGGAVAVTVGVVGNAPSIAGLGGIAFVAGLASTSIAVVQPVRRALGPSRGLVSRAYLVALAFVAIGATLATLFVVGWAPVTDAWPRLKPAHAWLNLVGFVSLVIATTLMHFFPTTVGARISAHRSGRTTILSIAIGGALVPLGFATGLDVIASAGATVTFLGSLALVAYVVDRWRERARWTTDPGWHRFVVGGLVSAVAWFVVGISIATLGIFAHGADPAAWRMDLLAAPLVAGWVGLAVIASASHLLPAVGPGDQAAHARQRRILGRAASPRLVVLDAGVSALLLGVLLDQEPLMLAGAIGAGMGFAGTAALIAASIAIGASSVKAARAAR